MRFGRHALGRRKCSTTRAVTKLPGERSSAAARARSHRISAGVSANCAWTRTVLRAVFLIRPKVAGIAEHVGQAASELSLPALPRKGLESSAGG